VDLALVLLLFGAHVLLAAQLGGGPRDALEVILTAPLVWAALAAGLALAWSWVFVALRGRTPGMAATGQSLRSLRGGALTPFAAFARATLAVLCAIPGLFGFILALVDARGQTLQDKVCRCVSVVD
jgi:hypothetical protein